MSLKKFLFQKNWDRGRAFVFLHTDTHLELMIATHQRAIIIIVYEWLVSELFISLRLLCEKLPRGHARAPSAVFTWQARAQLCSDPSILLGN